MSQPCEVCWSCTTALLVPTPSHSHVSYTQHLTVRGTRWLLSSVWQVWCWIPNISWMYARQVKVSLSSHSRHTVHSPTIPVWPTLDHIHLTLLWLTNAKQKYLFCNQLRRWRLTVFSICLVAFVTSSVCFLSFTAVFHQRHPPGLSLYWLMASCKMRTAAIELRMMRVCAYQNGLIGSILDLIP